MDALQIKKRTAGNHEQAVYCYWFAIGASNGRISEMATNLAGYPGRYFYRIVLLLLIIIPFIPEIIICATITGAYLKRCQVVQKEVCLIGSVPASDIIGLALQAKAGFIIERVGVLEWVVGFCLAIIVWLSICYVVLMRGWTRMPSRLWLGCGVALIFGVLFYFAPLLVISGLENADCKLIADEGGQCIVFGSHVGASSHSPAHAAGPVAALLPFGASLTFVVFAVFALVVARLDKSLAASAR